MPLLPIHDIEDERLAVYRDLLSAKASRRCGLFVAEGRLLVDRLVESSFPTHSILVDERRVGLLPAQPHDRPIYVTPAKLIEDQSGEPELLSDDSGIRSQFSQDAPSANEDNCPGVQ